MNVISFIWITHAKCFMIVDCFKWVLFFDVRSIHWIRCALLVQVSHSRWLTFYLCLPWSELYLEFLMGSKCSFSHGSSRWLNIRNSFSLVWVLKYCWYLSFVLRERLYTHSRQAFRNCCNFRCPTMFSPEPMLSAALVQTQKCQYLDWPSWAIYGLKIL